MDTADIAAKFQSAAAWIPQKKVKFDFGDKGVVVLDGVAQAVSQDDQAADTTIKIDLNDFDAVRKGELDPMTAFMTGKIKVEGDMSNAMQLQSVLSKLQG